MAMMISKFHKLIQSKVLWLIFLGVIVISFVLVYIPGLDDMSKSQRNAQRTERLAGKLYGEDVTRQEFSQAYRNVSLPYYLYFMQMGSQPPNTPDFNDFIEKSTWQHLAMLKKAQQLGITASTEEAAHALATDRMFAGQNGTYDPNAYQMMVKQIFPQLGMSEAGLTSYYTQQVIVDKLSRIPEQGALVTEAEIKQAFHLATDERTVQYVTVPRSKVGDVEVTEEMAKAYYENNKDEFTTPEKVDVSYVAFQVNNFTNQVEVTEEMIATFYENNKHRYVKEPVEIETEIPPEPTFQELAEVADEIQSEITTQKARNLAANEADILVSALAKDGATFEDTAQKRGIEIVSGIPPFSATDNVDGIDPTAPFQRVAMTLLNDEAHYYSDPVVGKDTVYVIKLNERLEPFLPGFDLVKDEATISAHLEAEQNAYMEKANEIHTEIKTALANGTAFTNAVASLELATQTTQPFTASTSMANITERMIQQTAVFCAKNMLCELITDTEEPIIAYVSELIPGNEMTELPTRRAELAKMISSSKSGRLLNVWREALLEEAKFEDLLNKNKKTESNS